MRFVYRRDVTSDGAKLLGAYLHTADGRPDYRFAFRRQDAAAGWTAHELLPGTYRYEVSYVGAGLATGTVVVNDTAVSEVVIQ